VEAHDMAKRDWDFLIWQRANDLLQQAERIHRNFLQVAAGLAFGRLTVERQAGSLRLMWSRLTKASG
jgi:hypothetical protein